MVFGGVAIGDIGYAPDLPQPTGTVYVGRGAAVYSSTDRITYTVVSGLPAYTPLNIVAMPNAPGQVWVRLQNGSNVELWYTDDDNVTWTQVTTPPFTLTTTTSNFMTSNGAGILIMVNNTDGKFWRTDDYGANWTTIYDSTGTTQPFEAAEGPTKIWIRDRNSTDGLHRINLDGTGLTNISGLGTTTQYRLHSVPGDDTRVFATAATGAGSSIKRIDAPSTITDISPGGHTGTSHLWYGCVTADGSTLVAIERESPDVKIWQGTGGGSLTLVDTLTDSSFASAAAQSVAVNYADPTEYMISLLDDITFETVILRSTDSGATWSEVARFVVTGSNIAIG